MKKILLVEDDDTLRDTLAYNLSQEDYKVIQTGDGSEALTLAREHTPDLIVLDIPLSDANGVQFLQKLRAAPETETIPVLILLSESQEKSKDKYIHTGASACLIKPFRPWQLLAQIEDLSF